MFSKHSSSVLYKFVLWGIIWLVLSYDPSWVSAASWECWNAIYNSGSTQYCNPGTPMFFTGVAGVNLWSCNGTPFTVEVEWRWVSSNAQCQTQKIAQCGLANHTSSPTPPTTNLCTIGRWGGDMNIESYTGINNDVVSYWVWHCHQWSSEDRCIARPTPWNDCGTSHQWSFAQRPTSWLCTTWTASSITPNYTVAWFNGAWIWEWSCTNNTITNQCIAHQEKAVCGPIHNYYLFEEPVVTVWNNANLFCEKWHPLQLWSPYARTNDEWNLRKWRCIIDDEETAWGNEPENNYAECNIYKDNQSTPSTVQCWTASGQVLSSQPNELNQLCNIGTPWSFTWSNPRSWTCTKTSLVEINWSQTTQTQSTQCSTACNMSIDYDEPIMCDIHDETLAWVCYIPSSQATFIVTNDKVGIRNMSPYYDLDIHGTMRSAHILVLSDERIKQNIIKIDNALEKIRHINGYTFTWKQNWHPDMWVLAQEVEKVFGDIVKNDVDGIKSVQYNALIAPIIEAINELNIMIDTQLEKANKQANHITTLEQKVK